MGVGMTRVVALVAVIVVILDGANALSLCNVTEEGFNACKPSISLPSPVDPTPECCATVAGADYKCLCSYKDSFLEKALGVDTDLAMALPGKCNLPPPDEC